jgi:hypothetical protein
MAEEALISRVMIAKRTREGDMPAKPAKKQEKKTKHTLNTSALPAGGQLLVAATVSGQFLAVCAFGCDRGTISANDASAYPPSNVSDRVCASPLSWIQRTELCIASSTGSSDSNRLRFSASMVHL